MGVSGAGFAGGERCTAVPPAPSNMAAALPDASLNSFGVLGEDTGDGAGRCSVVGNTAIAESPKTKSPDLSNSMFGGFISRCAIPKPCTRFKGSRIECMNC